jgi:two-component system OmpR family response regulator
VSTQPLVLVADDEPRITKLVSIALGEEGFRVVTAGGGEEALAKAEEVRPDIVLLDIVMPDLDGIEVMRQLRERRPVAVILLTAKGSTADKAKGLDLGADDYIAKPFSVIEVTARLESLLRRVRTSSATANAGADGTILHCGDLEVDEQRHLTRCGDRIIDLSPTEFRLLTYLMLHQGRVLSKAQILEQLWQYDFRGDGNVVERFVSNLRRKIDVSSPPLIHTVRGFGYTIRDDNAL